MKLPRRRLLHLAAGAVALPMAPRLARAQTFPSRPVRIVVVLPAGCSPDIVAWLMAQWLSERLGQQFIIDNWPGANGNVGTETAVRAAADGYTLLLAIAANAVNATLYNNLGFNFIRDIAPVAGIVRIPHVMEVNPSVPADTVPEFIAYAKANPGKINIASTGTGNLTYLSAELFKMMAGLDMVQVPSRGEAQAQTDLFSGRSQVMFDPVITSLEYIRSGKLRALAVTGAKRLDALLPDLPSIAEYLPGYDVQGFLGVGATKDTPADIVD